MNQALRTGSLLARIFLQKIGAGVAHCFIFLTFIVFPHGHERPRSTKGQQMGIKANTVRECILSCGESDPNPIDAVMTTLVEEGVDNTQMWEDEAVREFV